MSGVNDDSRRGLPDRRKRSIPVSGERRGGTPTPAGTGRVCVGADYSDDEIEFMLAMDRWKRQTGRPYPDCRDILAVAKSLGYRKGGDA